MFEKSLHQKFTGRSAVWVSKILDDTQIRMDQVTFLYDGNRDILRNVDMVFEKRKITAIVGASGSGKSTIAGLLAGEIKSRKGRVYMGGRPLETLSREAWYRWIGVINCHTYLFHDTVRLNFMLGKPQLTDEEIHYALGKVNLAEYIRSRGVLRGGLRFLEQYGNFLCPYHFSALPGNLTQTFASGDPMLDLLEEAPAVSPVTGERNLEFDNQSVFGLRFAYDAGKRCSGRSTCRWKKERLSGSPAPLAAGNPHC